MHISMVCVDSPLALPCGMQIFSTSPPFSYITHFSSFPFFPSHCPPLFIFFFFPSFFLIPLFSSLPQPQVSTSSLMLTSSKRHLEPLILPCVPLPSIFLVWCTCTLELSWGCSLRRRKQLCCSRLTLRLRRCVCWCVGGEGTSFCVVVCEVELWWRNLCVWVGGGECSTGMEEWCGVWETERGGVEVVSFPGSWSLETRLGQKEVHECASKKESLT